METLNILIREQNKNGLKKVKKMIALSTLLDEKNKKSDGPDFSKLPTPLLFNTGNPNFKKTFTDFVKAAQVLKFQDNYSDQLEELFELRNPDLEEKKEQRKEKLEKFIKEHRKGKDDYNLCGCWVYYPWTQILAHFLDKELYQEIRTARNKYLVYEKEQEKFRKFVVGIAGLSIGNSVALTLAYSGGCETMKLADPDDLSSSNLNRIRVPSYFVGVKKVYIAAHQIYEVNPYADLKLYPEGITKGNIEDFLQGTPKLNLVIEEMDNLKLKIFMRLAARAAKLPLIMSTDNGDNAIIDIERYDQKVSGTLLDQLPQMNLKEIVNGLDFGEELSLKKVEKVKLATNIVGIDNVEPRMQESLMAVGKSLVSWPQLGTAAFLGGVALTFVTKKLAIGEKVKTGKVHISLDKELLEEEQNPKILKDLKIKTEQFKKYIKSSGENIHGNYSVWQTNEKDFPRNGAFEDKLKFILNYALMAPSAHNTQPWKFKINGNKLYFYIDFTRELTVSDPTQRELFISLGAVLTNLQIALNYFGFDSKIKLAHNEGKKLFAEVQVAAGLKDVKIAPLFKAISKRGSDRSIYHKKAIPQKILSQVKKLADNTDLEVTLVEDTTINRKIAALVTIGSREIMKDNKFREELSSWVRHNFTRQPHGMPGFTTGLNDIQSIISPFLLKNYNIGGQASKDDNQSVLSASVLVIISSKEDNTDTWIKVGKLYEKIILLATSHGIKNGTMAALIEFERLNKELKNILKIQTRPQAFFRLGYSDSPIIHSPRLTVDQVLI